MAESGHTLEQDADGAQGRVTRGELVELLSAAVGKSAAEAAVERGCAAVAFGAHGSLAHAQRVLEAVAREPGLVGITARFAKARLALRSA